jgi:hypothetical protein
VVQGVVMKEPLVLKQLALKQLVLKALLVMMPN